jgi:hypothetical protein
MKSPVLFVFAALMLGVLSVRTFFSDILQAGFLQYLVFSLIVLVFLRLRVGYLVCPRTLLFCSVLIVSGIASVPLAADLVNRVYPPVLVVDRFEGDPIGAARTRFVEQLGHHWDRHQIAGEDRFRFSLRSSVSSDGEVQGATPLRLGGTERWLQVTFPDPQPIMLAAEAHPALRPFTPRLKLWGGGVSFGMLVDRFGATAEFLTLLAAGLLRSGEGGELVLMDASEVEGAWTAPFHRAVPLLIVAERRLQQAVQGENLQLAYVSCALQLLSHALALGSFEGNLELQAALRNDYGVGLWFLGTSAPGRVSQRRAIALWQKVATMKELPDYARLAAQHNRDWAVAELAKRRGGRSRKKVLL